MEENKEHKDEEDKEKKGKNLSKKKENLTEKIRENPWTVSTIVLGILALMILVGNFSIDGNVISEKKAGENLVGFLNQNSPGEVTLSSVSSEGSLYKVDVEYQEQIIPLYITKDGKYFIQGIVPLVEVEEKQSKQQQQPTEGYSEEDLVRLGTFSSCLAEKGIKIYGANWCGWTKKLVVETLGGFDVAGDAYVECTEETELCQNEGVTGYPTIKLDGEMYSGERTLEALAEATGCIVPELDGIGATASSEDASCN